MQVGGLARTVHHEGFRFDIGGHRFYTKSQVVLDMWREILGDEFLRRPRLSRIYYRGRFFDYPLKAFNVLFGLGLVTSAQVLLSYLRAWMRPIRLEVSFADWVTNRFGRAPVSHLLRDLHGEGVGDSAAAHRRAVGRAAHQGAVARVGGPPHAVPATGRSHRQDADRGVRVPETRARHDVGGRGRSGRAGRRSRADTGGRRGPAPFRLAACMPWISTRNAGPRHCPPGT